MPHVDPDRLALLALGETVTDAGETDHVDQCATCRVDLDAMRTVADLGRQTQELTDLPAPPERVWHRIAATALTPARVEPVIRAADRADRAARPRHLAGAHSVRRWPAWAREVAIAAAAAMVAVVGTLGAVRVLDPAPTVPAPPVERVAATAELAALPTAPAGSHGEARVLDDGTGERLHLHVTGLPFRPGYYEVWLINPDTSQMVSVGTLRDGGDELLPLPSTIDLRQYRLVDVSAEEYDGNALHSGRSMLRGTLSA